MSSEGIPISRLIPSGRARWTAIAVFAVLGGAGFALYTLWVKPVFRAEARLYFKPASDASPLGISIPSIGLGDTELNHTAGLLESFTLRNRVQKALGLESLDDVDAFIRFETQPEYGQIILAAEDSDRALALKAVNVTHAALLDVSRTTGFSIARDKAKALEDAVQAKELELQTAQHLLASFEKKRRAPTLPDDAGAVYLTQAKTAESELSDVRTQLDARLKIIKQSAQNPKLPTSLNASKKWGPVLQDKSLNLMIAEGTEGPDSPLLIRLKRELAAAQKQYEEDIQREMTSIGLSLDETIANLTVQKIVLESKVARFKELAQIAPDEAIQSTELARQVASATAVLGVLTQQFETARIDALVADAKWALVDVPHIYEKPVNKRFVRMGAIGVLIGVAIGLVWPLKKRRQEA